MEYLKRLSVLTLFLFFAFMANAQSVPAIVDQDEMSVTVKVNGEYKTLTIFDIVNAMSSGKMTELPLPYTKATKKVWTEYDDKMKLQLSKANANPFGDFAIEQIKTALLKVFSESGAMKDFIEKGVINEDVKDIPFGQ